MALLLLVLARVSAHAEPAPKPAPKPEPQPCMERDRHGRPFSVCFDPGNRLVLGATTEGYGGELRLRHQFETDPGINWRLEHQILGVLADGARVRGALYAGRYLRHTRDGHMVLPFRPTSKVFVPFDIGAESEFGRLDMRYDSNEVDLGAVRAALLFELTRAAHARRRLAVGAVAHWRLLLSRDERAVRDHRVAPLSRGLIDAYFESRNGLTAVGARIEAGTAWSNTAGWRSDVTADAWLERILIAVNDQPLSVYLAGRYDHDGWGSTLGVRLAFTIAGARRE